jgi:hypothetical protein
MVEPSAVAQAARTARAAELLRRAACYYDEPGSCLPSSAAHAAWGGFSSGARWMGQALEAIREHPRGLSGPHHYQVLGVLKYALAAGPALLWIVATLAMGWPELAWLTVAVFYAVEAQFVFLFPLALDGCPAPFQEARRWTVRAGGTWKVMQVVLPLAASMLGGGFLGRGFLRSWCLGCLAICVWYADLSALPSAGGRA